MLASILAQSRWLRPFIENTEIEEWPQVAFSWLVTSLVVAVLGTFFIMGCKWLRKTQARNIRELSWSSGQTIQLLLFGLLPTMGLSVLLWWTNWNFFNYVGTSGLMTGILTSWVVYGVLATASHRFGPWKHELF